MFFRKAAVVLLAVPVLAGCMGQEEQDAPVVFSAADVETKVADLFAPSLGVAYEELSCEKGFELVKDATANCTLKTVSVSYDITVTVTDPKEPSFAFVAKDTSGAKTIAVEKIQDYIVSSLATKTDNAPAPKVTATCPVALSKVAGATVMCEATRDDELLQVTVQVSSTEEKNPVLAIISVLPKSTQ